MGIIASGRRRAIRTGTGLFLITVGAIMLFALRTNWPRWLDLRIVGLILMIAGALGMLLPWLASAPRDRFQPDPAPGDRLRRWVVPRMPRAINAPPRAKDSAGSADDTGLVRESDAAAESPTLADDILSLEHDPPL
jgi:hypothetical protein